VILLWIRPGSLTFLSLVVVRAVGTSQPVVVALEDI